MQVQSEKAQTLLKTNIAEFATENQTDITKTVLDGESMKPYSTRNQEYETQDKPAILEEPEEESKEEKIPKLEESKE